MLDNSRRRGAWAAGAWLLAIPLGCDPNLPPEPPSLPPVVRVPEPVPTVEGDASRNLLQAYIDRNPDGDPPRQGQAPMTWEQESRSWRLPFQAKRLSAALLIAAAHDRLDSLRFILTPDATWGWPDPRRPGARPVFAGDDGEAFFEAFRKAAQRLPANASWRSYPVPPGIQMLHTTGAEPVWTAWADGQPTLIVMHLVLWRGTARVDYVGFFEEIPTEVPDLGAYGPRPPFAPVRRPPPGAGESPAEGSAPAAPSTAEGSAPSPAAPR